MLRNSVELAFYKANKQAEYHQFVSWQLTECQLVLFRKVHEMEKRRHADRVSLWFVIKYVMIFVQGINQITGFENKI